MLFTFLWRDVFFNFITKKDNTHFIIIVNCTKSKYCSYFCNKISFCAVHCAKQSACAYIYQQNYCKLSFFFKYLSERMGITGTHIPVNKPYIISMVVFTNFPETHSFSLKSRMILTCKKMRGNLLTNDFQLFYFFYYF